MAWEFFPFMAMRWSGSFELAVRLESPAGQPRSVMCEAFHRRDDAEDAIARLRKIDSSQGSAVADPFEGQPIVVLVPVSGSQSPFGRDIHRTQCRFLAVIAEWPDGRRRGKVVAIPDSRISREVAVTLP
jgi:hypothetical protein